MPRDFLVTRTGARNLRAEGEQKVIFTVRSHAVDLASEDDDDGGD